MTPDHDSAGCLLLAVINQMDTSQAHLSSKGGAKDPAKADALSKDELHAVLKYGAQKMCVACPLPDQLCAAVPCTAALLMRGVWQLRQG